jgi:hypothetical protein
MLAPHGRVQPIVLMSAIDGAEGRDRQMRRMSALPIE